MSTKSVTRKKPGPTKKQVTDIRRCLKEGWDPIRTLMSVIAPRQQDTAYRSSGDRRELPPPLQDPEASPGLPHCCETHEQAPGAVSTVPGVCEPQLPIRGPQGGVKCYACCLESVQGPPHLHTPDEGNNSQHTPRKEAASIQTKSSPSILDNRVEQEDLRWLTSQRNTKTTTNS